LVGARGAVAARVKGADMSRVCGASVVAVMDPPVVGHITAW
jgi:hypothetical protein